MRYVLTLLVAFMMPLACWAQYEDYVWTTPSANSAGSMPLGGGGVGLNVWCDTTGLIHFYVSQSGTFDENNTLLKVARFRVEAFDRWDASTFRQTLHLDEGYMTLTSGRQTVTLWCDVAKPVIHIEGQGCKPRLTFEPWRTEDTPLTRAEGQQSSWKWTTPKGLVTHRDTMVTQGDVTTFWHQNQGPTVFEYTVRQQGLEAWMDSLYNPIKDRIFGGRFTAPKGGASHLQITLCNQQSSLDAWQSALTATERSVNLSRDRKASRRWWHDYMQRSYVSNRNYMLFRYMLGCNNDPLWPTKFNGGIFTFDAQLVDSASAAQTASGAAHFTPDYRRWGGGTHTAQNQRLVYWGMIKSGDYDLLQTQLDYYLRLLPTAELRSRVYWGHGGACYTEQMENFGLPNPAEYTTKRPAGFDRGVEYNAWLEYLWDTSLEFCQMALEAERYAPASQPFPIERYEPMILSCLRFFDEHYQHVASLSSRKPLDGNGHLVLYPTSGCETYKMTYNASSTIAALQRVATDARRHFTDSATVTYLDGLLQRLPPIPTRLQKGRLCIAPAEAYARINNVEVPQLYPVWPWRLYDGRDEVARNTWACDSVALAHRSYFGWKQDNIWAACLGLADEAYALTMRKLADGPYRFPAFWGPGYDWSPDHNWGGSAVIGMEEMLLQEEADGTLRILPAWPKDKDVRFRLHASGGRVVEVWYEGGQITRQEITQK